MGGPSFWNIVNHVAGEYGSGSNLDTRHAVTAPLYVTLFPVMPLRVRTGVIASQIGIVMR